MDLERRRKRDRWVTLLERLVWKRLPYAIRLLLGLEEAPSAVEEALEEEQARPSTLQGEGRAGKLDFRGV